MAHHIKEAAYSAVLGPAGSRAMVRPNVVAGTCARGLHREGQALKET